MKSEKKRVAVSLLGLPAKPVPAVVAKIIGAYRLLFGECPACNGNAPALYDCIVCRYNKVTGRRMLWNRFVNNH